MARLYLTIGSVPELRPLSGQERIRVLEASGAAYAKTPASRRNEWLRRALVLGLPIAAGLIVYLVFKDLWIAGLAMAVMAIVVERAWFHFHLTQLRPFMREVLQGPIPDAPASAAEQPGGRPWIGGLFFGAFMAGAMLLTEDRLPWWFVLPLAAGLGLFFGIGLRLLQKGVRVGKFQIRWLKW